jgi:hypothetical protein
MLPHTDTAARARTFTNNICPQCSARLLAPDWSEYVSKRCVRHAWSCNVCGYEFETTVIYPAQSCAA